MRESLILIIYISAIAVKCTNLDDGFNLYKNHLRALPADEMNLDNESEDPVIYFYRTPLQLYPGLFSKIQAFRRRILNRQIEFSSVKKRTSKAALSLMLQSKHADHTDGGHYCPYGK